MTKNIPAIAEKIKFWEEQDKINQAVIPRIIEMNEALKMITGQMGKIDTKIAAAESRTIIKLNEEIVGVNKKIKEQSIQITYLYETLCQRISEINSITEAKLLQQNELIQKNTIEQSLQITNLQKITNQNISELSNLTKDQIIKQSQLLENKYISLEKRIKNVLFPQRFKIILVISFVLSIFSIISSILR